MSSGLPTDDTPDTGSNYGLDGFTFVDDYGDGVEEGGRLPQARPHAQLPDGTIQAEFLGSPELGTDFTDQIEFGDTGESIELPSGVESEFHDLGDLGAYMKEGNIAQGPVDLSWLEGVQDPERLPETPSDKALKGIQESWGERTDGKSIHRLPYVDPDRARAITEANETGAKAMFTAEQLANLVQSAMRKSAAGLHLKAIVQEFKTRIGLDHISAKVVKPLLEQLADEHGLAGKVFIRAAAYPGCHNGRWKAEVRKNSAESRYLIAGQNCRGCINNIEGSCGIFKKRIVADVPWKNAFNFYARKLSAAGVHVASTGKHEDDLRKAFGAQPVRQRMLKDERPVHVPVERLSAKAADDALAKLDAATVQISKKERGKGMIKHIAAQVQRWRGAGLLTEKEVIAVLQAEHPATMFKKATLVARKRASAQTGEYKGTTQTRNQPAAKGPSVRPSDVDMLLRWAAQKMSEGAVGADFDQRIKERFSEPVIAASHDKLKIIRSQHEGLSGFAYIHAAAYASGKRDEGCAKGAARLRTRGPRKVLAMDRCKGCTRNHGNVCARYNKPLVAKPPVSDKKAFQEAILKKAAEGSVKKVYGRGGARVASAGESLPSLEVNPVDEYNLGGGAGMMVDTGRASADPIADQDISFDGGITF